LHRDIALPWPIFFFAELETAQGADEGAEERTITSNGTQRSARWNVLLAEDAPRSFAPCSRIVERFAALSVFVNLSVKSTGVRENLSWPPFVGQLSRDLRFNGGKMNGP
jgi:hypothetical protein